LANDHYAAGIACDEKQDVQNAINYYISAAGKYMEILSVEDSPSLKNLITSILSRAEELKSTVETNRTDASCPIAPSSSKATESSNARENLPSTKNETTVPSPLASRHNTSKSSPRVNPTPPSPTPAPSTHNQKLRSSEIDVLRESSIINGKVRYILFVSFSKYINFLFI